MSCPTLSTCFLGKTPLAERLVVWVVTGAYRGPCSWAQAVEHGGFLQPEPISTRPGRGVHVAVYLALIPTLYPLLASAHSVQAFTVCWDKGGSFLEQGWRCQFLLSISRALCCWSELGLGDFFFCLLVGAGNSRMRGVQGELQDGVQLWVLYFLTSCSMWPAGWGFGVFFVSFLPPDFRRGKKCCLPLCTWFKTARWNWQDGDVAHTRERDL